MEEYEYQIIEGRNKKLFKTIWKKKEEKHSKVESGLVGTIWVIVADMRRKAMLELHQRCANEKKGGFMRASHLDIIRKNVLSSQPLKAAFKPPRAFQGFGAPKACKDTPQILGTLSHLKVLGYSLRCFENI
ncbi:hypothetical protein C8R42DRAFT_647061 [Lentinula raphanica]|nr:hypothetical protein C8R42DRAFT_647061 [Lentinula raphanica]